MKQNLDLLITGGNVFLHNELIEEIDIGFRWENCRTWRSFNQG